MNFMHVHSDKMLDAERKNGLLLKYINNLNKQQNLLPGIGVK